MTTVKMNEEMKNDYIKCDWCEEEYDASVCFEVNGNYTSEVYKEGVVSHEEIVCADCLALIFSNDPEQIVNLDIKKVEAI